MLWLEQNLQGNDILLEPNHFTFPEKLRTFKTLLLSLEFSVHQEICTRRTEYSNGTNRNQRIPEPLVWKCNCFV